MAFEHLMLTEKQRRKLRYMRRKHKVSKKFLVRNREHIRQFLLYAICPHAVLRTYAIRSPNNRIIIHYSRLRRLLFEPRNVQMIKERKKNVKRWSSRMVAFLKGIGRIKEYEETETYDIFRSKVVAREEVTKQLKEQLELLKSGKRVVSLMDHSTKSVKSDESEIVNNVVNGYDAQECIEVTPEKQIMITSESLNTFDAPAKLPKRKDTEKTTDENVMLTTPSVSTETANVPFLDRLINKVRVKNFANESYFKSQLRLDSNTVENTLEQKLHVQDTEDESSEDFLGFDDSEHQPGMLLTPLVPKSSKTTEGNSAFVSESLNEYMRKNNLCESSEELPSEVSKEKVQQVSLDGLVTSESDPPHMDMPAVPESLQKLRTVAERRQYLQRFSKTHKMVLINNEANVYRELQRKARQQKVKAASMLMLQAPSTQMPFTRNGWQAASYVATDYNKYYYQTINIDGVEIKLPGSLGNNEKREKSSYDSKVTKSIPCYLENCVDAMLWRDFKIIKSKESKAKLNHLPLPVVFRPCPLSHKAFQKPIDDDTAALLLAGGSMAVVSMPTVELQIFPEIGKPLNEIAKRYLQYILPHHDISREWAKFSVSTLQLPHTLREAEKAAAKTVSGLRKSFTFAIPYINDRSQILVRRVVDRSEKLDESFEQSQTEDAVSVVNDLSFRANLVQNDSELLECADVLSELINSVAISCSENSFIKEDPDGLNNEHNLESGKGRTCIEIIKSEHDAKRSESKSSKYPPPNRQTRLRLELRRLNATVIEAAAKNEKDVKPCLKEYCQLGCVCDSIAGDLPLREHCRKASCVLECTCKAGNHSRIMRLETDGRGISNEDAFMLRRRATARLAPMEKEFTSTVVLTENETLLINESQRDKKRRCTKAPKRYEDFADTDEDYLRSSPKKPHSTTSALKSSVMAIDTLDSSSSSSVFAKIMELREPCSVLDKDFEKLKHCVVPLRRLPDMSNVVVYCMTHQLYKCFCGGDALEGKPVVIEKEEVNTTISHNVAYVDLPVKARYSFDKVEKSFDERISRTKDVSLTKTKETLADFKLGGQSERGLSNKPMNRGRSYELDVIYEYFKANPNLCRRVVSVPTKCYTTLNRKRKQKIHLQILKQETPETATKLMSHIDGAMRFYRNELELKRRLQGERVKSRYNPSTNVIELNDDDDEDEKVSASKKIIPPKALSISEEVKKSMKRKITENPEDIKPNAPNILKIAKIDGKYMSTQSLLRKKNIELPISNNANGAAEDNASAQPSQSIQIPRISGCYSLSGKTPTPVAVASEAVTHSALSAGGTATDVMVSTTTEMQSMGSVPEGSLQFKEFYQDVVKNMNGLVSKKMQDIDMALQRDSKLIPTPNEEILCIIKWTNFLAAFESEFVFIWEVKMRNYSFLAATLKNMMPIVCGAIGVVNITGLRPENLPLLAQMLLQRTRTLFTDRLAVVMQGRKQYWLVKGYLLHMSGNACTKPTPQTHPLLTKKINHLCSLLVKQRIKEHQRRVVEGAQQTVTHPVNAVAAPGPSVPAPPVATTNSASHMPPTSPPPLVNSIAQRNQRNQLLTAAIKQRQNKVVPLTPPTNEVPPVQNNSVEDDLQDESRKIKSNVEFRKVYKADVDELMLPERHGENHRWLVLDLYNDFSHIFVPAFKDMISLDRIHNVMSVAREKDKIVKLQFFQNAPYDAFVTPTSQRKIYFGPLKLNMTPPLLVLLQSVDGRMMLREVYQREHNIIINVEERTTAFWVLHINGQIHFEIEMDTEAGEIATVPKSSLGILKQPLPSPVPGQEPNLMPQQNEMDSDDDDCMIIDDEPISVVKTSVPVAVPAQSMNSDPTLSLTDEQNHRLNFTIKATNNNTFQITPLNNNSTSTSMSNATQVATGSNASPDAQLMQIPTASGSGGNGFLPLVPILSKNVRTSTGTSSFIHSPLTTPANNNSNNEAIIEAMADSSTGTYLTPQVKMTPTLEPETFSERQTQTPPPSKKSRISVNTNTTVPLNSAMVNLLSPLAYLPKETTLEFEKTTVGSTTITRLNDGNKDAASSTKDQGKIKPNILNGKTKMATTPVLFSGLNMKSESKSTVTKPKSLRTGLQKLTSTGEVCLKRTASGNLKMPKLLTASTTTKTPIAPKTASLPTKPLNKMQLLFSSDLNPSTFQVEQQTNKNDTPPSTRTTLQSSSKTTQNNKPRLSLPTLGTNSKSQLQIVSLPSTSTSLAQKPPVLSLKGVKFNVPPVPKTAMKTAGNADRNKAANSVRQTATSTSNANTTQTEQALKIKMKPVLDAKLSHQKSLIPKQQNLPKSFAESKAQQQQDVDSQESSEKKLPKKMVGSCRYGYVYAYQMPKFVVKIDGEQYLIKVPNVGILKLKGMKAVNTYLNMHLANNPSFKNKLPATWLFVPHKRDTKPDSLVDNNTVKAQQGRQNKLNTVQLDGPRTSANATMLMPVKLEVDKSSSSMLKMQESCDPILIED